jgi:hypothetical protein
MMKEARRNFKADAEAGFQLRHILLTTARLCLEIISVLGFPISLFASELLSVKLLFAGLAVAVFVWRFRSLLSRRRRMEGEARRVPLWDMLFLDYGRRFWTLVGYVEGLDVGRRKCLVCRGRLRAAGVGWW